MAHGSEPLPSRCVAKERRSIWPFAGLTIPALSHMAFFPLWHYPFVKRCWDCLCVAIVYSVSGDSYSLRNSKAHNEADRNVGDSLTGKEQCQETFERHFKMLEEGRSHKEVIVGSNADCPMFMRLMKNLAQPYHRLQIRPRADAQINGWTLSEPFDKTQGRPCELGRFRLLRQHD